MFLQQLEHSWVLEHSPQCPPVPPVLTGGWSAKHCPRPSHLSQHTLTGALGGALWYSLGLVFGALQVCVVLLYGVQGDVADVAGVAAFQPCEEKPELVSLSGPGEQGNTLVPGLWTVQSQNGS